jgi:hypothetical protein
LLPAQPGPGGEASMPPSPRRRAGSATGACRAAPRRRCAPGADRRGSAIAWSNPSCSVAARLCTVAAEAFKLTSSTASSPSPCVRLCPTRPLDFRGGNRQQIRTRAPASGILMTSRLLLCGSRLSSMSMAALSWSLRR